MAFDLRGCDQYQNRDIKICSWRSGRRYIKMYVTASIYLVMWFKLGFSPVYQPWRRGRRKKKSSFILNLLLDHLTWPQKCDCVMKPKVLDYTTTATSSSPTCWHAGWVPFYTGDKIEKTKASGPTRKQRGCTTRQTRRQNPKLSTGTRGNHLEQKGSH